MSQACTAARTAVELAPDRGESHYALGHCLYAARDYDRALEEFATAAETLPGYSRIALSRAAILRRVGRWEDSIPEFERALELDPRDGRLWIEIGLTANRLGRYDEAERHYLRALEVAPDFMEAKTFLAIARTNREASRASFRRELEALEPAAVHRGQMTAYVWRMGLPSRDYDRLFDLLSVPDTMLSQHSLVYPRDLLVAVTHELAGDPGAAAAAYQSVATLLEPMVENRPDYAPYRSALGLAYAGLGRKDEAIREGLRAAALVPVERDAMAGPWLLADLGFIYARTGDHGAAVDTFELYLSRPAPFSARALQLDPRLEPLLDHPRFRELVARDP